MGCRHPLHPLTVTDTSREIYRRFVFGINAGTVLTPRLFLRKDLSKLPLLITVNAASLTDAAICGIIVTYNYLYGGNT